MQERQYENKIDKSIQSVEVPILSIVIVNGTGLRPCTVTLY